MTKEVILRLENLDERELDLLIRGDTQEQAYILWLAVCRCYRFIGEFAVEVLREKYLSMQPDLSQQDYEAFFNRKAEWHSELANLRTTSRKKLQQVFFRIMREAGLVSSENLINGAMLSPGFLAAVKNRRDLLFFPVFDADVRGVVK